MFANHEKVRIAKLLAEVGVHQIEVGIPAMGGDEKGEKSTLENVTFALKEIKGEGAQQLGVFAITVTFKMAMGKGMSMAMALAGTMTLRAADGWPECGLTRRWIAHLALAPRLPCRAPCLERRTTWKARRLV